MTSTYPVTTDILDVQTVYQPQDDSRLLVSAMQYSGMIPGRRVLDLCTGSGYVAIAAAEMGCASVTAFDICPYAVHFSQGNAIVAGVDLDVREGSWIAPLTCAPFDVVLA
ncbi:50S ribosomal protein L11 methyltransferase, partial [Mycobacterium montefiorense]